MPNYNNYFPAGYQYYTPQFQQPVQSTNGLSGPTGHNGIIWVQGEAGAKSYLVAPNTTVQLWDSESQTIYLKSADASGMPSIKTLDYTIREMPNQHVVNNQMDFSQFVTREELEEKLNSLKPKVVKKEKPNE